MDEVDLYRPNLPTTFGSASWATVVDLHRAGMLEQAPGKNLGPIVGCLTPAEIGGTEITDVFAPGESHLLTLAPTGAGKGRGQIITNLLWWPGSAVVVDIKGENWRHTAGWRASQGHRVIRFAPFENGSARWNPLTEMLGRSEDIPPNDARRQESARYLANLMITPNTEARNPYWDNASRSLLQGLLLHVATAPLEPTGPFHCVRERSVSEARRLLTQSPTGFAKTLLAMAESPEDWVAETASTLTHMRDAKEQSASLKTTLMEHMSIWAFRRLKDITSTSSFSFEMLRDDVPTTIYFVIPPEVLTEYRGLLRVLVGSCMRTLREGHEGAIHDRKPPVLMMLDEFPQLGYMQPIEDALLYIRSYGVRFWFFVQDLSQLKQHYKHTWQQFIANCGTRCFFGVSDYDTAQYVSQMSGTATVRNRSYTAGVNEGVAYTEGSSSGSGGSSGPGGSTSSWQSGTHTSTTNSYGTSAGATLAFAGRPLFMPDEVLRMPFEMVVGFFKGMPAFRGRLKFWDQSSLLGPRGMIPPPNV